MTTLYLLLLLCCYCFLTACLAAPSLPLHHLSLRVAEYDDIASEFTSFYKVTSQCPDAVTIGDFRVDQRQVALVQMSAIQEDGNLCTGPFDMTIVSEATVERPGLLQGLDLAGFQDALDVNTNAGTLIESTRNTSMLVGWHAGNRLCGGKTYSPQTVYFIVKEAASFTISLSKQDSVDKVSIPPFLRSLLIIAPNNNICFLADRSSAAGSNPTLVTEFPNGTVVNSVITPDGPSVVPTPDTDNAPPSPLPSPLPSPQDPPTEPTPSATAQMPEPPSEPPATPAPQPSGEVFVSPQPSPPVEGTQDPNGDSNVEGESPAPTEGSSDIPDDEEDSGSACFPGHAEVLLATGQAIPMSQLQLGDTVQTASGASRVIFFTHRDRAGRHRFVRLTTASGRSLTVSGEHYIYSQGELQAAHAVQIGDEIDVDKGVYDRVTSVEDVSAVGLYNPQTENGELIVDGFRVSAYTMAVHPRLAHHLLMPMIRTAYRHVPRVVERIASMFNYGSPVLAGVVAGPVGLAGL